MSFIVALSRLEKMRLTLAFSFLTGYASWAITSRVWVPIKFKTQPSEAAIRFKRLHILDTLAMAIASRSLLSRLARQKAPPICS